MSNDSSSNKSRRNLSLVSVRAQLIAGLALMLVGLAGCADDPLRFTEVKGYDERVTQVELKKFFKIVKKLPKGKLPEFRKVFTPPEEWDAKRTLPIRELVQEERQRIAHQWDLSNIVQDLKHSRRLQRTLRRERMTMKQFVGLSLTIGLAISRQTLRENQDLEQIIAEGKEAMAKLDANSDQFSELPASRRYTILQEAVWVTRLDRAEHLEMVPLENVALVAKHQEQLSKIFPAYFRENPLDPIADELKELGIPFHVSENAEFSDLLDWDPGKAIGSQQNVSLQPANSDIIPR